MFLFCVCQVGSEALLKREVARRWPDWRLAFSRPGFVTFKTPLATRDAALDLDWDPIFARRFGVSLGPTPDDRLPAPQVRGVLRTLALAATGRPMRLHVFPAGMPHDSYPCPHCMGAHDEIAARAADAGVELMPGPEPQPGDLVADIAWAPAGAWWVGLHRHRDGANPWPGGNFPVMLHPDAPSRAWLKLEETVRWSGLPLASGDTALEVGCAPGGASLALLQRGLDVIGVDPGQVDPVVTGYRRGYARFTWLPRRMQDLSRSDLARPIQWLLFDVNAGANVVLPYVERLLSWTRQECRGLLWTVKLNTEGGDERLPQLREQVAATGLVDVRCAQLSTHHRELLICGRMPPARRR